MKSLTKYKCNWLLILAIIFYCQFLLSQLLIDYKNIYSDKYINEPAISSFIILLLMFFIIPIIEEVIFRGFQSKYRFKKKYLIAFFIGSSLIIYFTKIIYFGFFILITPILIFLTLKNKLNFYKNTLIIYSVFLFTIGHFNVNQDIKDFFIVAGNFIGGGFLLSWLSINFGLLKSIIAHCILNILMFFIFVNVNKINVIDNNKNINYNILQRSFFDNSTGEITRTKSTFEAKNAGLQNILHYFKVQNNKEIFMVSSLIKFDLQIIDEKNVLEDKEILEILEQNNIIQIYDKY